MPRKVDGGEVRWQVVEAMLDEFPELREKAKEYLESRAVK
jgi:hypothetical protein